MTEPDVALTDFGLALECGVLTVLLLRRPARPAEPLRAWFLVFFSSAGLAALLGGVVHGFLLDAPAQLVDSLWLMIVVAAGLTALSCWAIGAKLLFNERTARRVLLLAIVLFAAYLLVVLFVSPSFRVVVVNSTAAAVFLLIAYLGAYRRSRCRELLWGVAGIALMLLAGAIQESGLDLHPRFTHNALYHVVVAIALYLIFRSMPALCLLQAGGDKPRPYPASAGGDGV